MSRSEVLTDEYLVKLLEKDAKAISSRAGYGGVSKRPGEKPKPNTRFLRNILRDTDNHNAALLAKEAEESRARLEKLKGENRSRASARPEQQLYSARSRREQNGRGESLSKRARIDRTDDNTEKQPEQERSRRHDRPHRPQGERRHEDRDERPSKRHRHDDSEEDDEDTASRRERHSRRRRREDHNHNRHRSQSREHHRTEHKRRRSRNSPRRSRSRSRSRSRERNHNHRHRERQHAHDPEDATRSGATPSKTNHRSPPPEEDYSSDPLDSIIGPALPPSKGVPAIQSRGRGIFNNSTRKSTLDRHFSSTYDPNTDVEPSVNDSADAAGVMGDDWDQALEAMRDRAKWKAQGADRLRAAGFSEEEVAKWEAGGNRAKRDGGGEDEMNVKWAKAGEGREWDRGKVIGDEDASRGGNPELGRLKGT